MNPIRCCLLVILLVSMVPAAEGDGVADRAALVRIMTRIAQPVLESLAEGRLKERMQAQATDAPCTAVAPLEAFGRTLAGIAPWLELGPGEDEEGRLRARFLEWTRRGLAQAVDPASPDRMLFAQVKNQAQPLVDAAFLAHGLLRAPKQLLARIEEPTRGQLLAALAEAGRIVPGDNNWQLFAALVECAVWDLTGSCNLARIQKAVDKHQQWYVGDGTYGDGPEYHWDYYNSFVIQPMLLETLRCCERHGHDLAKLLPTALKRAKRYAAVQERLIAPDASFPVIGRSMAYRFGAFQHLADIALHRQLPGGLEPAAVRCALNAVVARMVEAPGTFDAAGWLRIGAVGHQPSIREGYISMGSSYLCLTGLVHLGLPADDPLWAAPAQPWTQQRIWSGADIKPDHALKGR